ncbi:MAG: TrkH family potassium uptake protein [Candidatus Scatomorpha sp.]
MGIILLGSILLTLPISSNKAVCTPFVQALFTATSAVCVTGLVVHDTATYWSVFGQIIIILLIQIGGMGVVTVAVFLVKISGKKISLMQRSTMQEALAAPHVGGIVRLTNYIIKTALTIELIGAAIMAPTFIKDFGLIKGVYYAVFHSISAFCNAGFDLMGVEAPFSSLVSYSGKVSISLTVCALIASGGIGFLTWEDIKTNRHHFRSYRLQSKVILITTLILITVPTLYFFFIEFASWHLPMGERVLVSLFQAITPRTAGFNSVDLLKLSEPGKTLMIALMLIGGSPGSTAGGMKTTTFAVLLLTAIAVFRKKRDTECFGRRVTDDTIRFAAVIFMLYITLFFVSAFMISHIEKLPMLSCLFETASAIGTVGLSLGITPSLTQASWIILICLMFLGRVGGLTLIFAFMPNASVNISKFPQEKIAVG